MSKNEPNLAIIAATERANIFEPIENKLDDIRADSDLKFSLVYEINTLSKKHDAVTINTGSLRISIRAFVSKNPVNGEIINAMPISVSIWKDQDFILNEGCETPIEKAFNNRDFSNHNDALDYVFKEIKSIAIYA